MDKYKPGYMGKVMPADDPSKLTDFVVNKYDAFSKIYDSCKDKSEKISDIKAVDSDSSDKLSVKITTDEEVMKEVKESTKDDPSISVDGDVITAKSQ